MMFQLRQIAPEYYEDLVIHDSWVKLIFDFIFDPKMSLCSRVKRKVAANAEFHFYGVGAYSTSHVYKFCQSVSLPILVHLLINFIYRHFITHLDLVNLQRNMPPKIVLYASLTHNSNSSTHDNCALTF